MFFYQGFGNINYPNMICGYNPFMTGMPFLFDLFSQYNTYGNFYSSPIPPMFGNYNYNPYSLFAQNSFNNPFAANSYQNYFNFNSLFQPSGGKSNSAAKTNNNDDSGKAKDMASYAKQFNGKSASEMKAKMTKDGYKFHNGLWCGDFSRYIAGKAVGNDNLADWYLKCNSSLVPALEKAAKSNSAMLAEGKGGTIDTSKAKPGCLVTFDYNHDGKGDHVAVFDRVEGNKVYVIHGNYSNKVVHNANKLSDIHSFIKIT